MEKAKKSKTIEFDSDSESIHSILSINPDEPLVNDIGHHLFLIAMKKAREERQQIKKHQKNMKLPTIIQRQNMLIKKKKLTIEDIDRLFEEKRLRPASIKTDLYDLYQKSTYRIRSMLDLHQIDEFIQNTQKRKILN